MHNAKGQQAKKRFLGSLRASRAIKNFCWAPDVKTVRPNNVANDLKWYFVA